MASARYKLCVQGGVPTLLEATDDGEGGEGGGEGRVSAAAGGEGGREGGGGSSGFPLPGKRASATGAATSNASTAAAAGAAGCPVAGEGKGRREHNEEPVSGRDPHGGGGGAAGSNPHGAFVGMEVVGEGAAAAAAAAEAGGGVGVTDFGPPMTESEAVSIAGTDDAFFGFGNDMRVSI